MTRDDDFSFRAARCDDAEAVFSLTKASIGGLAGTSYSKAQLATWMGKRTPAFYEALIAKG
ncbi:MAG TPA: hypothetical protein VKY22_27060 [Bradyrhizobium sp.]|jgi:hypothetical protein|nr:hypothetical protein [Bradyrhizobium sp.]